jgi:glycosyltransferase involved in cell wall biosynthesis
MTHAPQDKAPLRVLQLNSLLTGGGTDDQCVKLTKALQHLGVQAELAGPAQREFSAVALREGVPFNATPPEGPLKLRFILAAAQLIRTQGVQLVHGHHGRDIWPTILAARLSGRRPKIVLTRHLAKSPSSWFSRRFVLGQCDALIAVSHFVAKVLREGVYEPDSPTAERRARHPLRGDHSKIHVIHGGIDTERFRPFDAAAQRQEWGLQPGDFAFGVVGGYDLPRGKGQREFLRAAAQMQARVPQARFLIIGRGNLRETLLSDIAALGLDGKAWLTPYCKDMPAAMNALDCLVHPQVGTEAFPGVVLEAFACGKPVIASALDGVPEAFATGNYGTLVPPEAVDELAAALARVAAQRPLTPAQRAELHDKMARHFSLSASALHVKELYEHVMNPQQKGPTPL